MLGVFVNRRENIELDGVRILEFIDQQVGESIRVRLLLEQRSK